MSQTPTLISLREILESLQSSTPSTRTKGLASLRHNLRSNYGNSKTSTFNDKSFQPILKCLIELAKHERATFERTKTTTAHTVSTNRLTDIASALRISIETLAPHFKLRTVRSICDHVQEQLFLSAGILCEPIALDYVKGLRTLLSYHYHVEHLVALDPEDPERRDWEQILDFCLQSIKWATTEASETDVIPFASSGQATGTIGASATISSKSSRSLVRSHRGSQSSRPNLKQITDELAGCVLALLNVTNAPLASVSRRALRTMIDFLQASCLSSRSAVDTFQIINRITAWARTEDMSLIQEWLPHMTRVMTHFWTAKSFTLKDEIICLVLSLQPYIRNLVHREPGSRFCADLSALCETIRAEYSSRPDRDLRQMSLTDFSLVPEATEYYDHGSITTSLFRLRSNGIRIESNWILLVALADMLEILSIACGENDQTTTIDLSADSGASSTRPRKRQKVDSPGKQSFSLPLDGNSTTRIGTLQVLCFLLQRWQQDCKIVRQCIQYGLSLYNDDDSDVVSWSYLLIASCAIQRQAADPSLDAKWSDAWQYACTSLNNGSTARVAAYSLYILQRQGKISREAVTDLMRMLTESMPVKGPTMFVDSVSLLTSHLIKHAREQNAATARSLTEAIANWFTRTWTPSRFQEWSYVMNCIDHGITDVARFIATCINGTTHLCYETSFPNWDFPGQSWLAQLDEQKTVIYMLLEHQDHLDCVPKLQQVENEARHMSGSLAVAQISDTILSHIHAELSRINEILATNDLLRSCTIDALQLLCKVCCASICITKCLSAQESELSKLGYNAATTLLKSLCQLLQVPNIDQTRLEAVCSVLSAAFSSLHPGKEHFALECAVCEETIAHAIAEANMNKPSQNHETLSSHQMDIDDLYQSQESSNTKASLVISKPGGNRQSIYDRASILPNCLLYSVAVTARVSHKQSNTEQDGLSISVIDYIVGLPDNTLVACRYSMAALSPSNIALSPDESYRFLEHMMSDVISRYQFGKSEAAIGIVLEFMTNIIDMCLDKRHADLYGLGLEIYEWCTRTLARNRFFSPLIQHQLARLLNKICLIDVDYPNDATMSSARTSLFGLVQKSSINIQYDLAGLVPLLFGRFVLATHQRMFSDLLTSLPTDSEWLEGIAMRLLFLSRLAASWRSLLRECVYYIFETAGRVSVSAPYAARCIQKLASKLPLQHPRKLFGAFASQLLHTWLESHKLEDLPFQTFGFDSLKSLLVENKIEACAQLVMRAQLKTLDIMAELLSITTLDLVKQCFAKSLAYAMSRDLHAPASTASVGIEQSVLRTICSKDQYKALLIAQFPTVIGHFTLTSQLNEPDVSWLEKRPAWAEAWSTYQEIVEYSQSNRTLPSGQQPSWRGKYLCDQAERLWKRLGRSATDNPWEQWSFALVARMLIDSINESLGSLHTCLVIRRIRVLVCMGGAVACTGFPLELLIYSLRPFASDSECADDAIGILHYLLRRGQRYLVERPDFLIGTVITTILHMLEHSNRQQDTTTQESQHKATLQRMRTFQQMLVQYLRDAGMPSLANSDLLTSLPHLSLPGNARQGSAESQLMLFFFEQWEIPDPLCSREDCLECLSMLSVDFQKPSTINEDCFSTDVMCIRYAQTLFEMSHRGTFGESFLAWIGTILGRSHAASGSTLKYGGAHLSSSPRLPSSMLRKGITASQHLIISRICLLLRSRDRKVAGLADHSLREIQASYDRLQDSEGLLAFQQMVPSPVLAVLSQGSHGYIPSIAQDFPSESMTDAELIHHLEGLKDIAPTKWSTRLADGLCRWSQEISVLSSLPCLLSNIESLAEEFLPSIIHIILQAELDGKTTLRGALSRLMTDVFRDVIAQSQTQQKIFLRVLLYLRDQPYPGESTRNDRQKWLEVDYVLAAEAASRCEMPYHALLLAEAATVAEQTTRRSSNRTFIPLVLPADIPDRLVTSILLQIDEPDSYYGLNQPATMDSVLSRLDHERDGFKSLMLRTAQVEGQMRLTRGRGTVNSSGLMHSLAMLNMNSLIFTLRGLSSNQEPFDSEETLNAAQVLQQWDSIQPVTMANGASNVFVMFKDLSAATDALMSRQRIGSLLALHMQSVKKVITSTQALRKWLTTTACLTEAYDMMCGSSSAEVLSLWQNVQSRQHWMRLATYDSVQPLLRARKSFTEILSNNSSLRLSVGLSRREALQLGLESLLTSSKLNRQHDQLQGSLSDSASLNVMLAACKDLGMNVEGSVKLESAQTLWSAGEISPSVKMLREVLSMEDLDSQDIPVGRAGLNARLSHQLAAARLEKPEEIYSRYLKPAIDDLKGNRIGAEAGEVFFEFASFCDGELKNPVNIDNYKRICKMKQAKEKEVANLNADMKAAKRDGMDRTDINRSLYKAQSWLEIDTKEERRLKKSRDMYVQQSLQNYMLALSASDAHDLCILRLFAIWLENADESFANAVVAKYVNSVRSWKFVRLMNQLMSRLHADESRFQASLKALLYRVLSAHPYHSLHHLYCSQRSADSADQAAQSRAKAAKDLVTQLQGRDLTNDLLTRFMKADDLYDELAQNAPDLPKGANRVAVKDWHFAAQLQRSIPGLRLPPATITLPLKPSARYEDAPIVVKWDPMVHIFSGNSHPKVLIAVASDGQKYRQLFKSGSDDLRQDAIMEQVFLEVSGMLQQHKATRQRDLKIRTYNVIPLTSTSGIIEFVRNSVPINDWLRPAHQKYHPQDFKDTKARDMINNVKDQTPEIRVKKFREICDHLHPVLRHFFFERFSDPDEWFARRTAYTRTTASVSMLGHVLGLGDRHCSNIMLDEVTGEVVHIDLGIAFEAGRVLPIPELVPFRLTRDIIDGMGVTGVEGVFRRCCEFTMDALRDDRASIMTLLNVLRYDPLYAWTMSPVRAKRMQQAQETADHQVTENGNGALAGGKEKVEDAGEADRALSVVEKKLAGTLSTAATVNELIQQATDERNLATLFHGWAAFY